MTTKTFETKEQFIAFKTAWANAAQAGTLDSADMMLYNIIRGKHPQYGFTPTQNLNKMYHSTYINYGVYSAWGRLKYIKDQARQLYNSQQHNTNISEFTVQRVECFLETFKGTLTLEQLINLELPKTEIINANYGRGKRLYEAFCDGLKVPSSCIQLNKLYNEFEKEAA